MLPKMYKKACTFQRRLSLSIKFILPPIGGRKSISRRKKGHFFAKKCPSSKNSPLDCF